MKILNTKILKNGQTLMQITVEPNEIIQCIRDNSYYKLRGPIDDVVASHFLCDPYPVYWCSIRQEWVSA